MVLGLGGSHVSQKYASKILKTSPKVIPAFLPRNADEAGGEQAVFFQGRKSVLFHSLSFVLLSFFFSKEDGGEIQQHSARSWVSLDAEDYTGEVND